MIAKELVGPQVKAVIGGEEVITRVVGYTTYGDCIIDAGLRGCHCPGNYDRISEECGSYCYLRIEDILKVL